MSWFKKYLSIIILTIILIIISCTSLDKLGRNVVFDRTPPEIVKGINIIDYSSNYIKIAWAKATDNTSKSNDIKYKVLYSTDISKVNSLTNVTNSNPDVAMDWRANITNWTITNLLPNTMYYLSVIVKDSNNNIAYYGWTNVKTIIGAINNVPPVINNLPSTLNTYTNSLYLEFTPIAVDSDSVSVSVFYSVNNTTNKWDQLYSDKIKIYLNEGNNTIKFWAVDSDNNISPIYSYTTYLDTTPPTAVYDVVWDTNVSTITINVNFSDAGSGVARMFYEVTATDVFGIPHNETNSGYSDTDGNFTVNLFMNKVNIVKVWAVDKVGNVGNPYFPHPIYVDNVPPVINYLYPEDNTKMITNFDIIAKAPLAYWTTSLDYAIAYFSNKTDSSKFYTFIISNINLYTNGDLEGVASTNVSLPYEGQYAFWMMIKDRGGNITNTGTNNIVIVNNLPIVDITLPVKNFETYLTNSDKINLSGTIDCPLSGQGDNKISYRISNAQNPNWSAFSSEISKGNNTTWEFNNVAIAEGKNIIEVRALNNNGEGGKKRITVLCDRTPPLLGNILIPSISTNIINNTFINVALGEFAPGYYGAWDKDYPTIPGVSGLKGTYYQINNGSLIQFEGIEAYISGLVANSENTITIYAIDYALNTNSKSTNIKVDTAKPVVNATIGGQTVIYTADNSSKNIDINISDPVNSYTAGIYQWYYQINNGNVITNNGTGQNNINTQISTGSLTQNYSNVVKIWAVDYAGNVSDEAIVSIIVDNTSPSVQIYSPANGLRSKSKTIVVNGKGNDNLAGVSKVYYSTNNGANWYEIDTANDGNFNFNLVFNFNTHSIDLKLKVKDRCNNESSVFTVSDITVYDETIATLISLINSGDVNPPNGANNIEIDTYIEWDFGRIMDINSLYNRFVIYTNGGEPIAGTITRVGNTTTYRFTPADNLVYTRQYKVKIKAGVKDIAGNETTSDSVERTFNTVNKTPPVIVITSPTNAQYFTNSRSVRITGTVNDQSGQGLKQIKVRFATGAWDDPATKQQTINLTGNPSSYNIDITLTADSDTITLSNFSGIRVMAIDNNNNTNIHNQINDIRIYTVPPTVIEVSPVHNSQSNNVVTTVVRVRFDKIMDMTSLQNNFILSNTNGGTLVSGNWSNISGSLYEFKPSANLERGTRYVAIIKAGTKALNYPLGLANNYSWDFRTYPKLEAVSHYYDKGYFIRNYTDYDNAYTNNYADTNVQTSAWIVINFNMPVDTNTFRTEKRTNHSNNPTVFLRRTRIWNTHVSNIMTAGIDDPINVVEMEVVEWRSNNTQVVLKPLEQSFKEIVTGNEGERRSILGVKPGCTYMVILNGVKDVPEHTGNPQDTILSNNKSVWEYKTSDVDWGFYFMSKKQPDGYVYTEKYIPGRPNKYFNPNAKTMLYFHGFAKNNVINDYRRENFLYFIPEDNTGTKWTGFDTLQYIIDDGWNFGLFYWNQFMDEEEVKDGESKMWNQAQRGGNEENGRYGTRYRVMTSLGQGTFIHPNDANYQGPIRPLIEEAYYQYLSVMKNNTQNKRIIGHSNGGQFIIGLGWLITKNVKNNVISSSYRVNRMTLLEAYWSKDKKTYFTPNYSKWQNYDDWTGAVCRNMMDNIRAWDTNIAIEQEKHQTFLNGDNWLAVGDDNKGMRQKTALIYIYPNWIDSGPGGTGDRHCYGRLYYFWSYSQSITTWIHNNGGVTARTSDEYIRNNMNTPGSSSGKAWIQRKTDGGRNTARLDDNKYTQTALNFFNNYKYDDSDWW